MGGAVSTVTDRRVTQNDDREHSIQSTYHAEYEHATYQGDATNNIGRLYVSSDSIAKRNFYIWTSSSISLQDYDVILHISLPTDFLRWSPQPLSVMYRSLSSDSDTNQLDISLVDTNGSPVSLSGSSLNLANTSWQTSDIEYTGSPTWTAGQDFLVNLKLHAKDDAQMHIADIHLNYTTLE